MSKAGELFEQYQSLRLQGQTETEAQHNLIYGIQSLDLSSQISLKQRFQAFEAEHTHADFDIEERTKLSNITLKIIFCPVCESPNSFGVKKCQVCEAILIPEDTNEVETVAAETPVNEVVVLPSIILSSTSTEHQFSLSPERYMAGIRLGRYSPSLQVELDLTELGAVGMGVSRLHAILTYERLDEGIYLTDLNSTNGTFVNGFKLPAKTAVQVHDGDELCLGRLKFRVGIRAAQK